MEDKEAIEMLKRMLEKYAFDDNEKEAILTLIGVLGWTKLVEGMIENKKRKRDRQFDN